MVRRRLFFILLLMSALAAGTAAWWAGFDVRARAQAETLGPYWVLAFPVAQPMSAERGLAELERALGSLHLAPAALYVRPVGSRFEAGALLHDADALAVGKLVRERSYDFKQLYFIGNVVSLPNRGRLSRYFADRRSVAALTPHANTHDPLNALARIVAPDRLTYALASTASEFTP